MRLLTSLDVYSAMSFAHLSLFKNDKKLMIGPSFWSDTVRRDHLGEDGARVLKQFAPGQIQVELSINFSHSNSVYFHRKSWVYSPEIRGKCCSCMG
jgi:hypothetical protein